jgi:sugar lactone lactonase YvrE
VVRRSEILTEIDFSSYRTKPYDASSLARERIDIAVRGGAELGESPVWDERLGCLWWVDIKRGLVHRHAPDGEAAGDACREIGEEVGAVALREGGGLVLAVRSGVLLLDDLAGEPRVLADLGAPGVRFNDAKCDPAGRLWAGTLTDDNLAGGGQLYRVDPDGGATIALDRVTVSNGLDWSLDGRTLYYVDSAMQRVDAIAFDLERGTLGERRPLIELQVDEGIPDGLTVDADGFLWLALFGGGAVLRIAPDGSRERMVHVPISHPTSCAFGGPDLTDLYITSAAKHLSTAQRLEHPHAGAVLRMQPGVRGRPANRFADDGAGTARRSAATVAQARLDNPRRTD